MYQVHCTAPVTRNRLKDENSSVCLHFSSMSRLELPAFAACDHHYELVARVNLLVSGEWLRAHYLTCAGVRRVVDLAIKQGARLAVGGVVMVGESGQLGELILKPSRERGYSPQERQATRADYRRREGKGKGGLLARSILPRRARGQERAGSLSRHKRPPPRGRGSPPFIPRRPSRS
jgi:hypothetical protein